MSLNHSYHIFMFPFRWNIPNTEEDLYHSQISLDRIEYSEHSSWERVSKLSDYQEEVSLYNEKNYFYEFVHASLYDNGTPATLIRHYERKEPRDGGVKFIIRVNVSGSKKEYILDVEAINLNLYSTGVGVLSFYLANGKYAAPDDILAINQYGRRVYPPFYGDIEKRYEIAESLEIVGLTLGSLYENFERYEVGQSNWPSPAIIQKLIVDIATNVDIKSVIDDRMYVVSWYRNNELASKYSDGKELEQSYMVTDESSFWYRFVFVDGGSWPTCQDLQMRKELIKAASYTRWRDFGTLYGVSRYSFMMLSGAGENYKYLYDYMETNYARVAELILVQRATVLRFSSEITQLSNLVLSDKRLSVKISSLFQEYIRFVNQIHFREITAQDQGIELYNILYKQMNLEPHVEKLDREIEELHNHLSIKEDRISNREMAILTNIATIFVPASLVTGFFGMNKEENSPIDYGLPFYLIIVLTVVSVILFFALRRRRSSK